MISVDNYDSTTTGPCSWCSSTAGHWSWNSTIGWYWVPHLVTVVQGPFSSNGTTRHESDEERELRLLSLPLEPSTIHRDWEPAPGASLQALRPPPLPPRPQAMARSRLPVRNADWKRNARLA